jgi:outer membrane protein OmpA-like peptidoglycan-associated protein
MKQNGIIFILLAIFIVGCNTQPAKRSKIQNKPSIEERAAQLQAIFNKPEYKNLGISKITTYVKNGKKGMDIPFENNILFDFDKYDVKSKYDPIFSEIGTFIQEYSDFQITVAGHTDSTGKKKYNQTLSEKRAEAVKSMLVKHGVDSSIISVIGHGMREPKYSNKTKEGRQKNRRAVISCFAPEENTNKASSNDATVELQGNVNKPSSTTVEPQSLSEILGGAWRRYKNNSRKSNTKANNTCSGNGFLDVAVGTGGFLSPTVKKFTVKVTGIVKVAGISCPYSREDSSGNGFFQGGYASFTHLLNGKYTIKINGYNDIDKSVFSVETKFDHPGSGLIHCNVTIQDKRIFCHSK